MLIRLKIHDIDLPGKNFKNCQKIINTFDSD